MLPSTVTHLSLASRISGSVTRSVWRLCHRILLNLVWGKIIPFLQKRRLIFIRYLEKKTTFFYHDGKKLICKKISKLKEGNRNPCNSSTHTVYNILIISYSHLFSPLSDIYLHIHFENPKSDAFSGDHFNFSSENAEGRFSDMGFLKLETKPSPGQSTSMQPSNHSWCEEIVCWKREGSGARLHCTIFVGSFVRLLACCLQNLCSLW